MGSGRLPRLVATTGFGLLIAAIADQLRRKRRKRTWHGRLLGAVPYDLRRPTWKRVRERVWNPRGSLIGPTVFGVGWSINLRRLRGR
jgi:hypothetical protein